MKCERKMETCIKKTLPLLELENYKAKVSKQPPPSPITTTTNVGAFYPSSLIPVLTNCCKWQIQWQKQWYGSIKSWEGWGGSRQRCRMHRAGQWKELCQSELHCSRRWGPRGKPSRLAPVPLLPTHTHTLLYFYSIPPYHQVTTDIQAPQAGCNHSVGWIWPIGQPIIKHTANTSLYPFQDLCHVLLHPTNRHSSSSNRSFEQKSLYPLIRNTQESWVQQLPLWYHSKQSGLVLKELISTSDNVLSLKSSQLPSKLSLIHGTLCTPYASSLTDLSVYLFAVLIALIQEEFIKSSKI